VGSTCFHLSSLEKVKLFSSGDSFLIIDAPKKAEALEVEVQEVMAGTVKVNLGSDQLDPFWF
jgi:hypothetical protein